MTGLRDPTHVHSYSEAELRGLLGDALVDGEHADRKILLRARR